MILRVQQHHGKMFPQLIAEMRHRIGRHVLRTMDRFELLSCLGREPSSQLNCCQDRRGLRLADSLDLRQLRRRHEHH